MLITSEVHYALLLMVYMAKAGDRLVKRKEVCEEEGIPPHFLAKIAQNLAKAGFIEIRQGSSGGYILTCDPENTWSYDIIEVIRGNARVTPTKINGKPVRGALLDLYAEVDGAIESELNNVLLVDLTD